MPPPVTHGDSVRLRERRRLAPWLLVGLSWSACTDEAPSHAPDASVGDSGQHAPGPPGEEPDGSGTGTVAWLECQPFQLFACCAWDCRADAELEESCPAGISGLDDPDTTFGEPAECIESALLAGAAPETDIEKILLAPKPFPGAVCGDVLSREACALVIDCVRARGGVDTLEGLGYPAPGSTSTCPPPPAGAEDAGGDVDAGGV